MFDAPATDAIAEAHDALAHARLELTAAKKRPYYNPRDDHRGKSLLQTEADCEAFLAPAPIEATFSELDAAVGHIGVLLRASDAGCNKTIRGLIRRAPLSERVQHVIARLIETAPGDRYADMTHRRARASFSPAQETGRQAIQWALRYGRSLLADAAGREVA